MFFPEPVLNMDHVHNKVGNTSTRYKPKSNFSPPIGYSAFTFLGHFMISVCVLWGFDD